MEQKVLPAIIRRSGNATNKESKRLKAFLLNETMETFDQLIADFKNLVNLIKNKIIGLSDNDETVKQGDFDFDS